MSVPFHKQTDPNKMAGQVVFHDHKQETTLAQYIARKQEEPPRITFEEWWRQQTPMYEDKPFEYMVDAAEAAWNAAIKHGKVS